MNLMNNIYLPLILITMIFLHIIDDFHLQGCFKIFKQKDYWNNEDNYKDFKYKYLAMDMYKNDWKAALMLHAFSWAYIIHLPIIVFILYTGGDYPAFWFVLSFVVNWVIHAIVDHMKANKLKINLIQDQTIHIIQIILTWIVYTIKFY